MSLSAAQHTTLRHWLPFTIIISCLTALFYITMQQHIRSEADWPQIQLAQDVAAQLFQKQEPSVSLPTKEVNMRDSLAPFIILYNSKGEPSDGSGKIDGKLPKLPSGVLSYTEQHIEHRFTWEPAPGVRIAAVVRYYQNDQHLGYVLAGRNLRESERQQSQLLLLTTIGWAATMCASLAAVALAARDKSA